MKNKVALILIIVFAAAVFAACSPEFLSELNDNETVETELKDALVLLTEASVDSVAITATTEGENIAIYLSPSQDFSALKTHLKQIADLFEKYTKDHDLTFAGVNISIPNSEGEVIFILEIADYPLVMLVDYRSGIAKVQNYENIDDIWLVVGD